jgi:hypothetical protein
VRQVETFVHTRCPRYYDQRSSLLSVRPRTFVEHRFRTKQHTDFQPQHVGHFETGAITGIPLAFKPSGLIRKVLLAVQRTDDSFLENECPFASRLPFQTGREEITAGRSRLINPSKPLSCAEAEMHRVIREDRTFDNPRTEW